MFKRPYCHICNHSSCTSIRNGYTEYRCTGLFFTSIHSPDYNPIELAFSKVKSLLKEHENEWKDFDVETAVIAALNTITSDDCVGWISHCGY